MGPLHVRGTVACSCSQLSIRVVRSMETAVNNELLATAIQACADRQADALSWPRFLSDGKSTRQTGAKPKAAALFSMAAAYGVV